MLQLQRNSNQKRGDVTDIQQISSETAKLFRWRLKKRVLCTHLHITPAAAVWPHRAMPRSSQYTVCILMLVLEEVWTGSGTSQQSIGDFWHHAHFAIIQLTADCGISKRKLEVSSIKTSLLPLVGGGGVTLSYLRLLMPLDCPGWHTSTTLNGSWGQCPFLAELQRQSPFENHNSLGGGAHPLIPLLTNSKCAFKNSTWGVDANQPLTLI